MKSDKPTNHVGSFHKAHAHAQRHQSVGQPDMEPGEGTPAEEMEDRLQGENEAMPTTKGGKK